MYTGVSIGEGWMKNLHPTFTLLVITMSSPYAEEILLTSLRMLGLAAKIS